MTHKMKNNLLNTLFSWVNKIGLDTIKNDYKNYTKVENLVADIEKYYKKRKNDKFNQSAIDIMTKKLSDLQYAYELLLTCDEDKHLLKEDRTKDVRTIPYSPLLLSVVCLDYMLHEEKDIIIRRRFGHHNVSKILCTVEEEVKDLSHSTYKIFNELIKELER